MRSRPTFVVLAALVLGFVAAAPGAGQPVRFRPGATGAGDPYFPRDGNGGFDAVHYDLALTYRPGSDRLSGVATMQATATQNLSRFDLDLDGLRVLAVVVDGRPAAWSRRHGELRVEPARGVRRGDLFVTEVTYAGVPTPVRNAIGPGVVPTKDGVSIMGQPHVASHWFPVSDHPSDKASYDFRITAPAGRGVVANGELVSKQRVDGWTTWHWVAAEPMASYLTTFDVVAGTCVSTPGAGSRCTTPWTRASTRPSQCRGPARASPSPRGRQQLQAAHHDPVGACRRRTAVVPGQPATPRRRGTSSSWRRAPPVGPTGRRCPT